MQFADDDTVLSSDSGGKTKVWDIAKGQEKTKALVGSQFALSKEGNREQQSGSFVCTTDGALLLIHLLHEVEDGGAGKATTAARAPVAFFIAPSPIGSLDCTGAGIALGCQSGEVVLLRPAVLLT